MSPVSGVNAVTVTDLLRARAQAQPSQVAYTFLEDGERDELPITFEALDRKARAIAALLQSLCPSPQDRSDQNRSPCGERVLLFYPPGLEYVTAFLGCLYAGFVAVPTYPPRRSASLERVKKIVLDAGASIALTTSKIAERRVPDVPWLSRLKWQATDTLDLAGAENWRPPNVNGASLALLQYTSGSTAAPKGVMVSHDRLLLTLEDMDRGWEHTEDSVLLSWLPAFHDMGLIYGILQPLQQSIPCVLMAPAAFLQRPIRWLEAITRLKVTHSGGPNFAYELCLRKITPEQRKTLDLRSWRMALNAAEPVRADTLRRFAEVFGPCGFAASAFSPGYGLAECTLKATAVRTARAPTFLCVSGDALDAHRVVAAQADDEDAHTLIGCGWSEVGTRIVIANPETLTTCEVDQIGEIWLSGPVVAGGYWNHPEETKETFHAYLLDTQEGPFLRTGDVGFTFNEELFVTGRLKDLIIIRGANHYPQDIELTVQRCHAALCPDCGAAFSVDVDSEERLVVVQEIERAARHRLDVAEIMSAVRQAITHQHALQVHTVVLIKTATLAKTSSGKVQRRLCRANYLSGALGVIAQWSEDTGQTVSDSRPLPRRRLSESTERPDSFRDRIEPQAPTANGKTTVESIRSWLVSKVSSRIKINPSEIGIHEPFSLYGLDSMGAVDLSGELEEWLGRSLNPTLAYDFPSIATLADHLADERRPTSPKAEAACRSDARIAVVGMSCRFPQADSPAAFWELLREGVDAVTEVDPSRWNGNAPRWGGFLDKIDFFDSEFFDISRREAEQMDPQQRLLLEVCWEALENAGESPKRLAGSRSGVFVGISSNEYCQLAHSSGLDFYSSTGTAPCIAANRISYVLDLRGPSWAVDTACSSSLVAVHQALQNLRSGACDLALAGGVNLILSPNWSMVFQEAGMLSPDGRCKTFDAEADGYVRGEGCGVLVLKRYADAIANGDSVLALIRGSDVNQDGRSNGLTAPNGPSQQAVVTGALEDAGVPASAVSYIEVHGTGTSLGDPIEVSSLRDVLERDSDRDRPCRLGSVKTNVGHLEAAAGICGLIKVILALEHEAIPPHLNLTRLNPLIALGNTLTIPTELTPWRRGEYPRIAGVSSFGFGGTNAHVVLEEPPPQAPREADVDRPIHLLALSAKSAPALRDLARRYGEQLGSSLADAAPADICFTANNGRGHFKYRLTVTGDSTAEMSEHLLTIARAAETRSPVRPPTVAFLFTGQGSTAPGVGRELYLTQPTYRRAIEECDQILKPILSRSLVSMLYSDAEDSALRYDAACSQCALFAIEHALSTLWRSWGVEPNAVLGHSLGEYAAACTAGCFDLEEGLGLIAERGRLMQTLLSGDNGKAPLPGEMLAIFAEPARVASAVAPHADSVSIAALNGPGHVVVSGAAETIADLAARFEAEGTLTRRLDVQQAFHSPRIEPMLAPFEEAAGRVVFRSPRIPLVSSISGGLLAADQVPDAAYWRRQTRNTVCFDDGIKTLQEEGIRLFVEIGPHPTLLDLGRRCPRGDEATWIPSLARGCGDWSTLLESVATAYTCGVDVDWTGFDRDYERRKLALPVYPFQRKRYWVPAPATRSAPLKEAPSTLSAALAGATRPQRNSAILTMLRSLVAELLRAKPEDIDPRKPFIELGADSIVFIDAVRRIKQTYGIKIPIRSFFEKLTTLEFLTAHLDERLPSDWTPPAPVTPSPPLPIARPEPSEKPEPSAKTATERIVLRQLDLMNEQLRLLRGDNALETASVRQPMAASPVPSKPISTARSKPVSAPHSAMLLEPQALSEAQQLYLDKLTARYVARTRLSKQRATTYRRTWADLRSVWGFRPEVKELCYPIVANRSAGSRFRDVDGNEYVDIAMGFGANMFGHGAPFIMDALQEQLERGIQVGPQSDIAGEVAALISKLTGMERVTFCNSGTEAVMTAVRTARAHSERTKIVIFSGAYHGHSDGTLAVARHLGGERCSMPMAPGIPQTVADDVLVLPYGETRSLDEIRAHVHELAAVLVEPVQSRQPGLQPRAFLHELREITSEASVALLFDEIITGFRSHPGGAQALFGIEADIATYGKVVGGGMPIGVVAGKAAYLDRVDGGAWEYGNDSHPRVERTFVAGTFCKHPLAMAAARAVLRHLETEGPRLQQRLGERTSQLTDALDDYFAEQGLPIQTARFGSLFRFALSGNTSYVYQTLEMDLLHHNLIDRGVYVWEGRSCFLSTAHSDRDLEKILDTVKESVVEMRQGGFWDEVATTSSAPRGIRSKPTLPLTSAQQQLWALSKMSEGGSLAYNVSVALELRGHLDRPAMEQAVQAVADRHEALRTRFDDAGDVQEILLEVTIPCSLIDLSRLPSQQQRAALSDGFREHNRTPFDLDKGPPLRAHLIRFKKEEHVLVIAAHHIVVDGWSVGVVLSEIAELYTALCTGTDAPPAPVVQLSDFVDWQKEQRHSEGMAVQEAYWLKKFAGPLPRLDLPTDRQRPALKSYAARRETMHLSKGLSRKLQRLGNERGSTLFMTLLSAYALLIHRLSGQDEVVIGVPASGRGMEDSERLVGYCAHLLPVRSSIAGGPSYTAYLKTLKDELLEDYEHQDYPFAWLLEALGGALGAQSDSRHAPLISVMFNLDRPVRLRDMPGIETNWLPQTSHYAAFDLSLNVTQADGELVVDLEGNTDLFDASTIHRFLEQYGTVLESLCTDSRLPTTEISLLNDADRRRMLVEWNDTSSDYPREICTHELFEAQVERTPDAVAVVAEDGQLTYGELNDAANRLAHHLQRQGAVPEKLVGICLGRSLDLVVGVMAVLKSGAAYVPLDPSYPASHLSYVVEHSQMPVLVTRKSIRDDLSLSAPAVVLLDVDQPLLDKECAENPRSDAVSANSVYVIYTSGSTGKPKGVILSHFNVVNFLRAVRLPTGVEAGGTTLLAASISFDVSVLELFLPLIVGARVVVVRGDTVRDGKALGRLIREFRPTMVHMTPSTYRLLIEDDPRACADARVFSGGDALPWQVGNAMEVNSRGMYNFYGPTEATVYSTLHAHRRGEPPGGPRAGYVPIGKPIDNTQVYLLDSAGLQSGTMSPVPVGLPGELLLGGDGLARGYLGRPALTAERFLPDPFSTTPGSRLYRTGDLARYRADGTLDFLARIDLQVKVRGYRIELGGIEAVLARHPNVAQAVVVARDTDAGEKHLVAYLVVSDEPAPSVPELRDHLAATLPAYMVPAAFVVMDKLPLSSNRKIDRKALPEPTAQASPAPTEIDAPPTATEEKVLPIYREVLKTASIDVHSDFFDVGGYSLLATRIRSRLRDTFQIEFPALLIFELPTVALLSKHIDSLLEGGETHEAESSDTVPALRSLKCSEALPLSFAQQRLWFLYQLEGKSAAFNMSGALRLSGTLDVPRLRDSLEAVVLRHEILRTTFGMGPEGGVQKVLPASEVRLPTVDLRALAEKESSAEMLRLMAAEARPFELESETLLRTKLLELDEESHVLLVTVHHIAFDAWSIGVFFRDLSAHYQALVEDKPLVLPEMSVQYGDFAVWQRQWLRQGNKAFETHLAFWKRQLGDVPPGLELPSDWPRPTVHSYRGARHSFTLPASLTAGLRALSRRQGCTPFVTLLTAFKILLHRMTHAEDIVIGTDVANRDRSELENLIGFFVNQLVLRTDLSGNPTGGELLARVRDVVLSAYAHQDIPFDKLVEVLAPQRALNRAPLFQIKIVFDNAAPPSQLGRQLQASLIERDTASAQLDLILFLTDTSEGIHASFEYSTDLFNKATIIRLGTRYRALLSGLAAHLDVPISSLEMRTAEERETLTKSRRKRTRSNLTKLKNIEPIGHTHFKLSAKGDR